jgi:ElaB/YqjD/DUF883 family membrane-anchored ribosome-binding protein
MNDYDIPQYVEDHRSPEEIEDDLERTRAEVSSTIDAIQNKLTPGQLMDQAFAYARTSLPAEFGSNLANTVRDNPVPVALMGVGIAWLMMSGRRNGNGGTVRARRQAYDDDIDHGYDAQYEDSGGMHGDKLRGAMESISEKGSEWRAQAERKSRYAADKASDLGHRISDKASAFTDRARNIGSETRHRVSDIGQRSQQQYYRAKDGVNRMVDEQPLMVGVLGLAAGALLGALLPSTRREDEMMGRTRDDLLDRARETASEQAEQLKESAKRVADVAKQEMSSVADQAMSPSREGELAARAAKNDRYTGSAVRPDGASESATSTVNARRDANTEYETVTGEETHV